MDGREMEVGRWVQWVQWDGREMGAMGWSVELFPQLSRVSRGRWAHVAASAAPRPWKYTITND